MRISILTLFPDFFVSPLQSSILKRAQDSISIRTLNIRDFATDKHQVTDERPYGGGPGMVMKIEPIHLALKSIGCDKTTDQLSQSTKIVLTTADGPSFSAATAREYSVLEHLVIICGHYEGVDDRVRQLLIDQTIRYGDAILTGGETAALAITESIVRLVPGVLGNDASPINESEVTMGKGAFPQFTRPEEYMGLKVPAPLLSGDHAAIASWREQMRVKVSH